MTVESGAVADGIGDEVKPAVVARLTRLVALLALAMTAAVALPVTAETPSNLAASLVARGVFAGLVIGLAGTPMFSRSENALLAAAGAAMGGALVLWRSDLLSAAPIVVSAVCAVTAAVGAASGAANRHTGRVVAIGLGVVALTLLMQLGLLGGSVAETVGPGRSVPLYEPQAEHYSFDGSTYLRTVDLMEQGVPYYEAHGRASAERTSATAPPPHFLNYRLPWLFRFWVALPGSGPAPIWWSLLALTLVAMAFAYSLASRLVHPGVALLAPAFVSAFYMGGLATYWFPFSEFWGGGLAIVAIALAVRRHWRTAALFLSLAIVCRELMVLLIPGFLIGWVLSPDRRRTIAAPVMALVIAPCLLALHVVQTPAARQAAAVTTWLQAGPDTLTKALMFFGTFVPYAGTLVVIAPVAALVGGALARPGWRRAMLVSSIGTLLAFLALVSAGGYYWGAIAMPLVLSVAPAAVAPLFPSRVPADGIEASGAMSERLAPA